MSDEYAQNIVVQYNYWKVYVHSNQTYLGHCIIWCDREGAVDLVDMTPEEQEELFQILPKIKRAIDEAFSPDRMNYAFLGNELRHLHGHVTPRYLSEQTFQGMIFKDKLPERNWSLDRSFVTPPEVLQAVKRRLQKYLQ